MKKLSTIPIFLLILNASQAQVSGSIADLIKDTNFIFAAQTAHPQRGSMRQLDQGYEVVISRDTAQVYLPYFGRTYTAPIDPSQGGIQFTSTEFDYVVKTRRKGGWDIQIKPKDARDVRILQLSVFENGSASLTVTSNSRQSISFNGRIEERK
jgi:hypothetical protein